MNLKDFKKTMQGSLVRLTATLSDRQGNADYELVLLGSKENLNKMLSKMELEVAIDQDAKPDRLTKESGKAKEEREQYLTELLTLKEADDLLKDVPATNAKTTVLASLRRIRGQGTFYKGRFQ